MIETDAGPTERNSLPLMGIGNDPGTRRLSNQLQLITPHGDRERGSATRWNRSGGTHYPSWGSGTGLDVERINTGAKSHYPSWGSGTRACTCPCRGGSSSLPLMGIGNGIFDWIKDAWNDSLPLMGIGNAPPLPPDPRPERTTHYPSWGSGTGACRGTVRHGGAHYPSWGSGTSSTAPLSRSPTHLITPHGDRELDRYSDLHKLALDSLPLMGIGNLPTAPPPPKTASLITPHGDREPDNGPLRIESRPLSLPLMGIGNRSHAGAWYVAIWSHYPSWGSGTCKRPMRKSWTHQLITPHGDREPTHDLHERRDGPRSLPLMGIGNRSHAGAWYVAIWSHYPSWGSGTCKRPMRKSWTHQLITPHGDRELRKLAFRHQRI